MSLLKLFFIRIPHKIFQLLFYKLEYLYYRFFYRKVVNLSIPEAPKRYFIKDDFEEIQKLFKQQFPNKTEEKVKEANIICNHIFDLLGSGPKKLSKDGVGYQNINWHSDFKSNYQWDSGKFFRYICFGHKEGVDIKVPWELSRFQHLTILGQAYVLSNDEKYALEFVNQVTDWIEHNRVGFGVNWLCPMDVAIRVVNWLVALEYFSESKELSEKFSQILYSSIYDHAKFVLGHLETKPVKTNHYLANIAGLFFVSVYCHFFKESKNWQKFAINELEKEIQHQVYPDGCNFEASTSYHRLALEMFFYCELLRKRYKISFSTQYQQRIKKMFEFSLYCIKPNGMIPQIGDNDNGRFLVFCKRPILNHKYLLVLSAIYYKDSEFNLPNLGFEEEALWVFGIKGVEIFQNLSVKQESITSKAFPDAGWYIMRYDQDYCFISCGSNGQDGWGGHAHNDKLSFELMLDGEDAIVDSGTYAYTSYSEWRNKFRSMAYHNTVQINSVEQNDLNKGIFLLKKGFKISQVRLNDKDNQVIFEGEINYLREQVTHSRRIILNKNDHTLQVIDRVASDKQFLFKINFCLAPNNDKKFKIEFQAGDKNIIEGDFSEEYGQKEKSVFIHNKVEGLNNFENLTTISKNWGIK